MDLSNINTSPAYSSDYNPDIQARINALLSIALQRHALILLIRFDVRYPIGYLAPQENSLFIQFVETYRRYLDRHGYDPIYLWCREQSTSANPHYHVFCLLDGTSIRYMPNLNQADEQWNRILGQPLENKGLIHFCNPNGTMLSRTSQVSQDSAREYLQYLAKNYTKTPIPGVRSWNSSSLASM